MAKRRALVLASGSRTRYAILKSAGLAFTVVPADIDEDAVRLNRIDNNAAAKPSDMARELARAKALAIAASHKDEIVIGADQILELDGTVFTKSTNRDEALQTLLALRGKTHELHTATAIALRGEISWESVETAKMTMREFSDEFAADYLLRIGDASYTSVGAYQIEGPGIQLFEKIDGDYFTILGLPILPLLNHLRNMEEIDQ